MISYCYGNTRSSIRLEQMLEELTERARANRAKVGSIITDCYTTLKEIKKISDKRVFEMLWQAWYTEMMKRISECVVEENVRDHLMGTVQGLLRNERRNYLITHKDVGKKRKKKLIKQLHRYNIEFEKLRDVINEQI